MLTKEIKKVAGSYLSSRLHSYGAALIIQTGGHPRARVT